MPVTNLDGKILFFSYLFHEMIIAYSCIFYQYNKQRILDGMLTKGKVTFPKTLHQGQRVFILFFVTIKSKYNHSFPICLSNFVKKKALRELKYIY